MISVPFTSCGQVYFGVGSIRNLGVIVRSLGIRRLLIVTDRGVRDAGIIDEPISDLCKCGIEYVVFDDIRPEPDENAVDVLFDATRREGIDGVIGFGGGSVMDCSKMAAVLLSQGGRLRDYLDQNRIINQGMSLLAAPTTSGTGSESTPNALFTVDGEKKVIISRHLIPKVAIIDPVTTLTVPPKVSAESGMDALVHACESFTSLKSTLLTEMYSLRAAKLIAGSIRTVVWQGSNIASRIDMALGSYLAGVAIGNAGTGAVHALAYPLNSGFGLSHGLSNSVMFPYVSRMNIPADMHKFAILAHALGANTENMSPRESAAAYVTEIVSIMYDIGLPLSLAELGVEGTHIYELVSAAKRQRRLLVNNPAAFTSQDITAIYERALLGEEHKF